MNYYKIYETLINTAQKQNRSKQDHIYYEKHHILPRCLNGGENKENKVLLTAREHFVAHKLLTYIYKENYKIISAFNLMTYMNNDKYIVTSRDYQYVRELYAKTPIDEETRQKRKMIIHTDEWNKKISNKLKNHHVSEETKQKISKKVNGIKHTAKAIENYKKGNKGKNIGVIHSKESYEQAAKKLRKIKRSIEFKNNVHVGSYNSRKKCECCHKIIPLNVYNRCHGKKCKNYERL